MIWYIISAVAFAVAVSMVVIMYLRDRRYMRMKVSQAMDPAVLEELEDEERKAMERRDKFKGALGEAAGEKGGNP